MISRILGIALLLLCVSSGVRAEAITPQWVRSFAAAPTYLPRTAEATLDHQTVRLPVRITLGGRQLQVRLSNEHGRAPVTIVRASLLIGAGAATRIVPLRFSGREAVTMPVGAPAVSDPIDVAVASEEGVEIRLYFDEPTLVSTVHRDPENLAVIVDGDFTQTVQTPAGRSTQMRPFLSAIDVVPLTAARTIVVMGDSISDWNCPYAEVACQWEGQLFKRLVVQKKIYGIANAAISGDRLLLDGPGGNAPWSALSLQARFDRDVLSAPSAKYVLLMIGINDIAMSGPNADPARDGPVVSAETMIAGLGQIIARAHSRGLKIYGAEILPFSGANSYSADKEAVRVKVNQWISHSGAFDGLMPFSMALADPALPGQLNAKFNNGDWLHPNAAGQRAMGDAIDLSLFE